MKDLKYLIAYIAPLSAIFGVAAAGWWSYSAFIIGFVLIPSLEQFVVPKSTSNFSETTETVKLSNRFFDFLLYLNLPLLYILLWVFFSQNRDNCANTEYHTNQLVGS